MPPIFLDANATTPVAPPVLEAVHRALRDHWGNPSSVHAFGAAARRAMHAAREQVAALVEAQPEEVVFTSGGTESDVTAVLGVTGALEARGRHLVITAVEHPAVSAPARALAARGARVTEVRVGARGSVDPDEVVASLAPDTVLVSVMHANNETGVLQPIATIAAAARDRRIVVHTDAAQSVGKMRVSMRALGVDLLTIAGHKMYGPKGVGALVVRRGTPLEPLLRGAGHERGRRAGTENVPGIVGLGAACALAAAELDDRAAHLTSMRDRLERALLARVPGAVVHGAGAERLPNTLSVAVPGLDAARALRELADELAASPGAACHASGPHVSHVLVAMGVATDVALATIRLSVSRETTEAEIDASVELLVAAAARHRGAPVETA